MCHLPLNGAHLIIAHSGAADGNNFMHTRGVNSDDIHISFNQNHAVVLACVNLRPMQVVEYG